MTIDIDALRDRGLWEYRVLPAHPRQRSLGEIL
jgi:hypothetical protein